MSPQLARRVAIVGTLSLGLFAILFFRLWFLQVLSSDQYAHAASRNFVRPVEIAAPRGEILDRTGTILARSQRAYAVMISPPDLPVPITEKNLAHPPRADAGLYNLLAHVVGLPTKRQPCHVNGHGVLHISQIACAVVQEYVQLPYAEATVATDISRSQLFYLSERQAAFPGVSVQQIYQRTYPLGDVASQVLGIVSRITANEVKDPFYKGASQNDAVGQSGLEASYDRYLRGVDGAQRVQVDALGNFVGVLSQIRPVAGSNLKLALDSKLEAVGQQALQESIDSNYPANAGAFVALNPDNGQVYAMGSLPTYNANLFSKPVPTSVYNREFGPNSGDPQVNRAYQSAGPTGSTFKPITSTAALESGVWSTGSIFDDTGQFCNSEPVPAQRRQRRRRLARPGERDQGLLGRLLLQPGGADQLAGAQWRAAPALGKPLWDRAEDRHRPPRRERRDAARRQVARCAQQARGRVRQGHRAVQGQAQASAGWLRDRLRRQPPMVDRRQREPRGRPGRRAGHAAPACGGLRGARQRWHDRHAAPGARRAVA